MRFLILLLLTVCMAHATPYYVRTDGNDSNLGTSNTSGGAWLTIQKAATTMIAGDSVTVAAGSYPERVSSVRAGTLGNPITFTASGTVIMRGWDINHAYHIVDGFTVKYASNASRLEGQIEIDANGDNSIVRNCIIGPGIWLKRSDFVFNENTPSADTITTATGGFIAAGFRAGCYIAIQRAETTAVTNEFGSALVDSVTDTTLTLNAASDIASQGAVVAYITGSYSYGLVIKNGATGSICEDCTFAQPGGVAVLVGGTSNFFQDNIVDDCMGWDGILYSGTANTFQRNLIRNNMTYQVYNPSPDAISNDGAVTGATISQNFVTDWMGALGFEHGGAVSNVVYDKNVFYNTHQFELDSSGYTFTNNTFVKVSDGTVGLASDSDHPIVWGTVTTSAIIKNNLFVGCGRQAVSPTTHGWYSFLPTSVYTANYNYVTGVSPGFGSKTGFSETNGINGGNPLFVNINDPLGPDLLPFTSDDGLRLSSGSPAIGAGEAGVDIGAYDYVGSSLSTNSLNLGSLIVN